MTVIDLEAIWRSIESESRTEAGWHVRRIPLESVHQIQAGRKMPDKMIGLLYMINSADIPIGTVWPDGKGFRTDHEILETGPNGKIRISLELTNPQYRDVFAALCSDIVGIISGQQEVREAVLSFIRRLHAWQKFMQVHSDRGLSSQNIRGLFAEISVIEQFLCRKAGPALATEMWQGAHALHDFRFGNRALEVKSSTTRTNPVIKISTLNQLDDSGLESLHLCFVPMKQGDGESLPDLISRLRTTLSQSPGASQRFNDLLVAAGYHDSQANLYSTELLSIGDLRFFEVKSGFPRIESTNIPEGIVSGSYSVAFSQCLEHEVDQVALADAFFEELNGIK